MAAWKYTTIPTKTTIRIVIIMNPKVLPITGNKNKTNKNIIVAKGIVSDKIYDHRAWIVITKNLNKVKLGDHVKIIYKKDFLEKYIQIDRY